MSDKIYQPPKTLKNPHIENVDEYAAMYKESIENPETFFGNAALQNFHGVSHLPVFITMNLQRLNGLKVESLILPLIALIGI